MVGEGLTGEGARGALPRTAGPLHQRLFGKQGLLGFEPVQFVVLTEAR